MPDLYTIFENGERNLRIEDAFSKFENGFVRVRKILENESFGTGDDAAKLYAFVGTMISRPPHRIDYIKAQYAKILEHAEPIKIDPSSRPMPTSFNSGPSYSLQEFAKFAEDPNGTWFPDDVAAHISVLSEQFGCDVLVNRSEHPFLTSDSPAVIYHPPVDPKFRLMPRGLGSPG